MATTNNTTNHNTNSRNRQQPRFSSSNNGQPQPRSQSSYAKYVSLGKEALSRGDDVEAQRYFQCAEHHVRQANAGHGQQNAGQQNAGQPNAAGNNVANREPYTNTSHYAGDSGDETLTQNANEMSFPEVDSRPTRNPRAQARTMRPKNNNATARRAAPREDTEKSQPVKRRYGGQTAGKAPARPPRRNANAPVSNNAPGSNEPV